LVKRPFYRSLTLMSKPPNGIRGDRVS